MGNIVQVLTAPITRIKRDVLLASEEDWMPLEIQARHRVGLASGWLTLSVCMAIVGGVISWAALTEIPEITRGEGKVISKMRKQVIQSLEGGLLQKMLVSEGDMVDVGQPIVNIDPTKAAALYDEVADKVAALRTSQERLKAEVNGAKLVFSNDLEKEYPELVRAESDAYSSRRKSLSDSISILLRNRNLIEKELAMLQPMADKGAVSVVEVLRLQRQSNELALQAEERTNKFKTDANAELLKVTSELAQFEAQGKARKDLLDRSIIKSPVKGVVTRIYSHTVGGVISPGSSILEISPVDDQLIVEAQIRPSDVAFLHPDLKATVKITAYDYSKYGGLQGRVIHISSDTFEDPNARNPAQTEPYYHALVRTEKNFLEKKGESFPIIPGMVASVEIETGAKTILEFIIKPLHRFKSALTER